MLPRTACSSCLLRRAVAHTEAGEEREGFRGDKGVGGLWGRHQASTENPQKTCVVPHFLFRTEENPERLLKNKDNSQNSKKQKRLKYC